MIDSILTNTMLPAISRTLLERQFSDEKRISTIAVEVSDSEFNYRFD